MNSVVACEPVWGVSVPDKVAWQITGVPCSAMEGVQFPMLYAKPGEPTFVVETLNPLDGKDIVTPRLLTKMISRCSGLMALYERAEPRHGSEGCMLHAEERLLTGVLDSASTAMMPRKRATISIAQEYTEMNSRADCCF